MNSLKGLKILDLTGAGDLFAAVVAQSINNFSQKNVWKKELKCQPK